MRRIAITVCLTACAEPGTAITAQQLSSAVKQERATLIRDSAAEMGLHNAALLGGIATSETNLAHCWEEAQFACMGPATPSCGGGPIIAGSADGACSAMQGGLGMFQFDAGTYAQTIATYTDAVLTVEGNTAQAVAFVVDKVKMDVVGATDWMTAIAWMDAVPMVAGDPVMEEWSHLIACRYNGCCSGSTLCESRADGYRDNAIAIFNEFGATFWNTADRCVLPEDGVIDQRSECYLAAGEPRFWVRAAGGFDDDHETTGTTAAAAPSNFGRWLLKPGRATAYRIEVHIPASISTSATALYRVFASGTLTDAPIDQTTADGFVALGEFELAADGSEYVELGDNTGTSGNRLVFDAIRVTAVDGEGNDNGEDPPIDQDTGCCGAGGGPGAIALAVPVLAWLSRRRRRARSITTR